MKKITELSLINKISTKFPNYKKNIIKGIGDDAAVVKTTNDKYLLFTCDTIMEGIHFTKKNFTPEKIGQKAAVVNISDIAAMGGQPLYCLVSLFLPEGITDKFIDGIYKGLVKECNRYGIAIIGGNITKSTRLAIDLFLVGESSPDEIIYRSGAKIGDKVFVTGTLGRKDAWTRVPAPRVREGNLLARSKKATAMIDISDGLSTDILHICEASQVGVLLYADKIPTNNIEKALNGGEDYELCFTAATSQIKGVKATVIGEIIPLAQGRWLINGNKKTKLIVRGWDHFQK